MRSNPRIRQAHPPKKRKLSKRQRLKVHVSIESNPEDNIHGPNIMDTPHLPNNSINTNDNCRRDDIYGPSIIDTAYCLVSWFGASSVLYLFPCESLHKCWWDLFLFLFA
eukprot:311079_1